MTVTLDNAAQNIETRIRAALPTGYITTRYVMPAKPDRVIKVAPYGIENDPHGVTRVYVQVHCRAPKNDPDEHTRTGTSVRSLLEGHRATWTDGRVLRCRHLSTGWLGEDHTGRLERTDNYELTLTPNPAPTVGQPDPTESE